MYFLDRMPAHYQMESYIQNEQLLNNYLASLNNTHIQHMTACIVNVYHKNIPEYRIFSF